MQSDLIKFKKMNPSTKSLKQKLREMPVIGYMLAWANALIRLPVSRRYSELQFLVIDEHYKKLEQQIVLLNEEKQKLLVMIQALTHRLDRNDKLEVGKRLMQLDQMQLGRNIKSLNLALQMQQGKEDLLQHRLANIENQLPGQGSEQSITTDQLTRKDTQDVAQKEYDDFYLAFESLFRGQREEIKRRLEVYIPYLAPIAQDPVKARPIIIDVGCGRGEWLELLSEREFPALGVDLNQTMVSHCLQGGLLARCADAIELLKEQVPGTVGAVTGFHLIEHLPFEKLLALFDAAKQALRPGGVLIFETPNPENLKVGACNFYFDPTHRHPIVPQVAEFIAKQRGFSSAEILRLHPYPDNHRLHGGSEIEELINKELFGPQDYAVIAVK